MKTVEWKINDNYREYFRDYKTDILCFVGGGDSGKSFFVLEQQVLTKYLEVPNIRMLILRKEATMLKRSVIQGVLDALERLGMIEDIHYKYHRTDKEIKLLKNIAGAKTKGNILMFAGLEDDKKVKSFKGISDIVLEEASDFTLDDYNQISIRLRDKDGNNIIKNDKISKQIYLMYNPEDSDHWLTMIFENEKEMIVTERFKDNELKELNGVHKKWHIKRKSEIEGEKYTVNIKCFRSNYQDNEFCPIANKVKIEELKNTNYQSWRKYRLGLAEIKQGVIFENWEIGTLDIATFEDAYEYGGDFGFSTDPTALIEFIRCDKRKILYITKEVIYSTNLTNQEIGCKIKSYRTEISEIVFDSAEPKSIEEINEELGKEIVIPSTKGAGSVESGIKKMKEYKIVIHPECKNVIQNFKKYSYKVDKSNNTTSKILKKDDHAIDGIRYRMFTEETTANVYM